MGMIDRVHRWSKYTSHSDYTLILRVRAVPAIQNPEIFEVQRVSTVTNPEILRVLAVSAAHEPEILTVHQVPALFFFSKMLYSQVLGASVDYCCRCKVV